MYKKYTLFMLITLCTYAQQGYAFGCVGLYVYYKYIYLYIYANKKQAVYCLTAQKSPDECIILISH